MKRRKSILLFISASLVALALFFVFFIKIYPIKALSIYSYMQQPSPVIWNNIHIEYKFGMHYYTYSDSIFFCYWGNEQTEGLSIRTDATPVKNIANNKANNDKEYEYISEKPAVINNFGVIIEEKIHKSNKDYYYIIRYIDFPVAVGFNGPKERLTAYQSLINSIRILPPS